MFPSKHNRFFALLIVFIFNLSEVGAAVEWNVSCHVMLCDIVQRDLMLPATVRFVSHTQLYSPKHGGYKI